MVKKGDVNVMQCYLPAAFESELEYAKAIAAIVDEIKALYPKSFIAGIPMLPEVVSLSDLTRYEKPPEHMIPIGLDAEEVSAQYLDIRESRQLIIGRAKTGRTNVLKAIIMQMTGVRFIYDAPSLELSDFDGAEEIIYAADDNEAEDFIAKIKTFADEREAAYHKAEAEVRDGVTKLRPKDFYSSLPHASLIIDEGDNFVRVLGSRFDAPDILNAFTETGGSIFTACTPAVLGYDDLSKFLKTTSHAVLLGNPNEQLVYNFPLSKPIMGIDIAYLYKNGSITRVKLPLV
jgi:S-DNA-T family DNA segregation ATPase FtsK/SpoIIIE